MALRQRAASVAAFFAILAGCAHDFDQFETGAQPDGGGVATLPDGATPLDASSAPDAARADAGTDGATTCPGRAACLSSATTCGNNCKNTWQTCRNACANGNPGASCRTQCDTQRDTCRSGCTSTCDSCLATAGCPEANVCANAVP